MRRHTSPPPPASFAPGTPPADEHQANNGNPPRRDRLGDMLGASAKMQDVYRLAERVAPTEATVLLIGETGTGKDVLAEYLHRSSSRRDRPFVAVNCGAMPRGTIESEIFGHERGSFTGAERVHRGCFERANGGTLFLDEVTEVPPPTQVKLLRILEGQRLTRVGGEKPFDIDVRIIAATNRSTRQAIKDGSLRVDLYHRLNVFPIRLPPLRERDGDVALLTRHFLDQLNRQIETSRELTADALTMLNAYDWPGNVRELKNAIEHSFILADDKIGVEMLPTEIREAIGVPTCKPTSAEPRLSIAVGTTLAEARRRLILYTLSECGGDKRAAAEILGVSLKTLYNRLKEYGTPMRPMKRRSTAATTNVRSPVRAQSSDRRGPLRHLPPAPVESQSGTSG